MPEIAFDPQVLTDLQFTLGGTEYSQAVSSCKVTPNQSTITFKGGKRNVNKMGRASYSCAMTIGQNYDAATSLVNYLFAHAGETVAASFVMNDGATVAFDLVVAAPEIGGDVDSLLNTTITHGVDGVPTITPPAG